MKLKKEGLFLPVLLACAALLPLAGCGSGGGGTTTPTAATNSSGETISSLTSGYAVPSTVSAVPASSTAASLRSFSRAVTALAATTDYKKAVPNKYIEEPVLDQFAIIGQVLSAIKQTKYNEAANINAGPYKAMVAFADQKGGKDVKSLQPWIVDSRMIVIDGVDVNRVLCWIDEKGEIIRAEFKVYSAATFDEAGEVTAYGKWTLNVKFGDDASNFFVASAEPNATGGTTIKINEHEDHGGEIHSLKGVLVRSNSEGYGKMAYTDYDNCDNWPCTPTISEAEYAYNAAYLGVKKTSDSEGVNGAPVVGTVVYKDRASKVEMTHRYGLFYNESPVTTVDDAGVAIGAGDDLQKHKQFGFPVLYTDTTGNQAHAYYGAWQGRHQLWGGQDGAGVPAGTSVATETWGDAVSVDYTVTNFNGSFTKRTYVAATPADILNVPVETWLNKQYNLGYNGTDWVSCSGWLDWSGVTSPSTPPDCRDFDPNVTTPIAWTTFTNYSSLVVGAKDRKQVNIGRWDNVNSQNIEYVYLTASDGGATFTGAGFYPATRGNNGTMQSTAGALVYTPTIGDQLMINLSGSIYIAYTGDFSSGKTGWVQKQVVEFNTNTYQPVFGSSSNDTNFSPEMGREYYMNANGVNYVVKRKAQDVAATDYDVLLEIQKTANPANCSASDCTEVVPATASYFRTPWEPAMRYALVRDSASANNLLLKYLTDDPNTTTVNESTTETVVSSGMWGLQAWNAGTDNTAGTTDDFPIDNSGAVVEVDQWGMPTGLTRPVEFNWEYCNPSQGQCWGGQTYLKDANNAYKILADPVSLRSLDGGPLTVTDWQGTATTKTLILQYDGWMHGLPDLHNALRQNNWEITTDIKNKIVNIPAGTAVTDGTDTYYLKPLETSIFLVEATPATGTAPDVTQAATIDLTTLPVFVEHGMGAVPTGLVTKYSEGIAVQ